MNILFVFFDKKKRLEPLVIGGKQKKEGQKLLVIKAFALAESEVLKAFALAEIEVLAGGFMLESHLAAVSVGGSAWGVARVIA